MYEGGVTLRSVLILREEKTFFFFEIELLFIGKFEFRFSDPTIPLYVVTHNNEEKSVIKEFPSYEIAEHWCDEMGYIVLDRW